MKCETQRATHKRVIPAILAHQIRGHGILLSLKRDCIQKNMKGSAARKQGLKGGIGVHGIPSHYLWQRQK
jgi:hypothetical protein